ncbi:MAG: DUF262 domain-containing protein [Tannerella sp.]|jgi:hypothetical protein|nr:DUF262 domain-containing protein [Tannerella sp.]
MSDNLKKYSFIDLLKQGKLRIPKIQRDYAQGRLSQKVDEIRKIFVHTLLLVVKGKRPATELDFVYGSNQNNAFEPLDGQQRLTTLFLLHWMLGVDLSMPGDKQHSVFTYETRNTSNEFCDELVQHKAIQFVQEARQKNTTPSAIIKGRDWFKWEWKYDPTILSMLVMVDAIYSEMGEDWWDMDLSLCRRNLEHITFNLLNLGEFGLSNELFIKMNARGKQLSDFDKLKSTLEEELQVQQKETNEYGTPLASHKDEEDWRTLMDGAWIDLFWHQYTRQIIANTESTEPENRKRERLKADPKLPELRFKNLLLRLIALQFFENVNISEKLAEAAYNLDDAKIDNLLFVYTDSLTDLRSDEQHIVVPAISLTLNFRQLIEDVNSLIYKDINDINDIYYEISYLLPEISHIDKDDSSLFDSFLETKVPNDVELTFYAMLLFLRAFPIIKKSKDELMPWYFDKSAHESWLKNLEAWVRATRNILLNDNNNQRIDKIQFSQEATLSLKQMAADLVAFVSEQRLNIEEDKTVVKKFLKSSDKTYQRLDNQSLAEERLKASLILNDTDEWETYFDIAENHPYLWGQIRCLLNWSNNKLDVFKEYSKKLLELLDCIRDNGLTYYSAMLVFAPNCWEESNRLFLYNKDRDNSFKRYMREHTKDGQAYGANIKTLIDLWIQTYSAMSAKNFLEALIADKKKGCAPWIQCVIKCPSILDEAWNKRIYSQNGHIIMAQRKTRDSHCFDPVLVYLRNICKDNKIEDEKFKLYDSKGEYEHAFQLETDGHKYLVEWTGTHGHYSIKVDDATEPTDYTTEDMISFMQEVIIQFNPQAKAKCASKTC